MIGRDSARWDRAPHNHGIHPARGSRTAALLHLVLQAPVRGFVSDADAWKELREVWKIDDGTLEIDFDRQFVLVAITHGSLVSITLERDSHGNLKVETPSTADLRTDGFRYFVAVVSREGVKSVNGEELPAAGMQEAP